MKHHILVKWKDNCQPETKSVQALFDEALSIPGVHSVSLHSNVVDRPNRYDLLILMCMDQGALETFDASDVHKLWKQQYGEQIAQKAIFDCD